MPRVCEQQPVAARRAGVQHNGRDQRVLSPRRYAHQEWGRRSTRRCSPSSSARIIQTIVAGVTPAQSLIAQAARKVRVQAGRRLPRRLAESSTSSGTSPGSNVHSGRAAGPALPKSQVSQIAARCNPRFDCPQGLRRRGAVGRQSASILPHHPTPGCGRFLHHILISNRFWLLSIVGEPFVAEAATRAPASLGAIIADFRTIHDRETAWLANATEQALSRTLENEFIPGGRCTISDALLQVCLHSQGHRAQCAKMLRALGGRPAGDRFHPLAGGSTRTRVASS